MRVSERMIFESLVGHMQRQSASLLSLQDQVASGKAVNKPSDDPIKQSQILNYDTTLATADQYLRNIGDAQSWVSVSESVLASVQNQLVRAHELALQLVNGTNTPEDRANGAKEVREIFDHLVAEANTVHDGRYIFAGYETSTRPFVDQGRYIGTAITVPVTIGAGNNGLTIAVDGVSTTVTLTNGAYATGAALATMVQSVVNADAALQAAGRSVTVTFDTDHLVITSDATGGTSAVSPTAGSSLGSLGLATGTGQPAGQYLGDSAEIHVITGTQTTLVKNLPGDRLFQGTGVPGGVNILTAVGGLQSALETDNLTGMETALTDLSTAMEQVSGERALLGARLNGMDATQAMLEDLKVVAAQFRSESGDVNLDRAVSDLVFQQNILQATREMASRMFDSSLLKFLR
ncbi:MAG: flagellar hook-associated protein FlgL [Nitrospirae bacterium]|nr:flagellar hook-associated protein FlgL [Nitrospirota bacterium]